MIAIATLLMVVLVSVLMTRVASMALVATGLPMEVARFQARSALTGVGFTTTESETMVNHPVRRRVLMGLMLLGNAGLVTIMASLMVSFANSSNAGDVGARLLLLLGGLALIIVALRARPFDRAINRLVSAALNRWTDLDVRDYVNLLQLDGEYGVTELLVNEGDWLEDHSLAELGLIAEGVVVLGIQRHDGTFIGAPTGATRFGPGDNLILYGRASNLHDLAKRRAGRDGDRAHELAIAEQLRLKAEGEGEGDDVAAEAEDGK